MKGIIYGIKFINPDTQEKFLKVGIAKYRAGKVGVIAVKPDYFGSSLRWDLIVQ